MKIKRQKLLDLIITEQTRLRDTFANRALVEQANQARRREDHERRFREAWELFSDQIHRRTAAHQPITIDDVPADLRVARDMLCFWRESTRSCVDDVTATREYRQLDSLRRLLEAIEDEIISTYGLEKAGYRLEHLMRASAQLP